MQDNDFLSCWQTEKPPAFPALADDTTADAVIAGAGLCGLLCAYELLCRGVRNIILIEADTVCSGTTARTTGKITSQHRLIYSRLTHGAGPAFAGLYARASQEAAARYEQMISSEKIDCDLERCDAYVYALQPEDSPYISMEAEAARGAGIPAEEVSRCGELPFEVYSALRFPEQAKFHPLKFCYRLASLLSERGVRIFEHTPAIALEDNTILTRSGKVYGRSVILCTHYPFLNFRGVYFSRIHQSRSCFLALENAPTMRHVYLDCRKDGLSLRGWKSGPEQLLLFGGAGHPAGAEPKTPHYEVLEKQAKELFPESKVRFRWSAQDCMTHDSVPFAGHYRQLGKQVYLATGFNKWGMTGCMAAAGVIADEITNQQSPYAALFSAGRKTYAMQTPGYLKQTYDTAASFVKGYAGVPLGDIAELKNGEGALSDYKGAKIGVYRDEEGILHGVSPYCTHMHCPLSWNEEEHTWDCPCHGSRFDADGRVLENPAARKLAKKGPV